MRVLIVNTSEHTGGAAIAAARLREALGNNGIKATMLVSRKESEAITVAEPRDTGRMKYNFLRERFTIWKANGFRKHRLFEVDAANFGIDITGMKDFEEADIIHLHWINQGFLSLKGIAKILRSGKPVVWTLHDMWAFTGNSSLSASLSFPTATTAMLEAKSGCSSARMRIDSQR